MDYLTIKWIHILSSTILFGTGIGIAFFMFIANLKGDIHAKVFASKTLVLADFLFTTPAVIVQFFSGIALVIMGGHGFDATFVFWGLILYFFAGSCWLPVVWMQMKMRDMAVIALKENMPLPKKYWDYNRAWIILGALAFPALVLVFYLMVFKP